jgi:cysteinyl-tRNA synthetase
MTELKLFNSLTRSLETFKPVHPGTEGDPNDPPEARVYSCGPTVYNYQHIGNMRAYVFADTLGRVLSYKGYKLTHVINITDVGHLTSDADAGEDKMEKMAASQGKSAWDIAAFYQADFEADLARLNIRKPAHPKATEYVEAMIEWGKSIADKHCYELDSGLYFDVSTVPEYGRLARAVTEDGEAQQGRLCHLAQDARWRNAPNGMGQPLGPRRARLASRMFGDVKGAARHAVRHPHRRHRPPRDPPSQ